MRERKIVLFWAFFKSTLVFNLIFPLIFAFSVPVAFSDIIPVELKGETPVMTFWNIFSICVMTVGPLVSFAYKEWARSGEYYFYNNRGISKYQLMVFTVAVNVVLGVSILIIKSHVASA